MKKFGDFVKQKREKKEISQARLAMLAGVDRTYIAKIEKNERIPTLEVVIKLLQGLETSQAEFDNVDFRKYPKKMINQFLGGDDD